MSWSLRRLKEDLIHVLKTSSTRLQCNNLLPYKTSIEDDLQRRHDVCQRHLARRPQDILKEKKLLCWRHLENMSWRHVLKTFWRRLGGKQNVHGGYLYLTNLNLYLTNLYLTNLYLTYLRQIQNILIKTQQFRHSCNISILRNKTLDDCLVLSNQLNLFNSQHCRTGDVIKTKF